MSDGTWDLVRQLALAILAVSVTAVGMIAAEPAARAENAADAAAKKFIAQYEQKIRPLEIEVGRRWWLANTTGRDDDFAQKQEVETQLDLALSDPDQFAVLKTIKEAKPTDPLLARQIDLMFLQFQAKQIPRELLEAIVEQANKVEKSFNVYRPKIRNTELTDNDVRKILKTSTDSDVRKAVWEASKGVGSVVEEDLIKLVKLRNQAAQHLGFTDFYVMQLRLAEQDPDKVLDLFDKLDNTTRIPFTQMKRQLEKTLAQQFSIEPDELRLWHYQDPFFQEPPAVFDTDLDSVYAKCDVLDLCRRFYNGIGLPIDDVIGRSDLYEKPGKSPHAFCIDIDREGDVRVLANIVANEQWMGTMLHELGHSVYSSKNIPRELPYALRTDAHILCTEGVAMLFERFSKSAEWLAAMKVDVPDPKAFNETASRMRRNQLLIFSRWCQVMLRFERKLYEKPDRNLNNDWWGLVEHYQQVPRPPGRSEPDFAAKIHIVSAPCYYHNYMMGQLFAAQVHHTISRDVLKAPDPQTAVYVDRPEVGEFMKKKVFAPGKTMDWNSLTRFATGAELEPKAFAEDIKEPGS